MSEQGAPEQIELPVSFDPGKDVVTRYATNLVVQHTEHEFVISFYEAEIPPLLGSPEENKARLQRLGEVQTKCVARVVVAPGRMAEFVKVLEANLQKFQAYQAENRE